MISSERRYTVLVAHPSADLYGSDRVLLESVTAFVEGGANVFVLLPTPGPLVTELELRGATVLFCPTPILRKSLLRPFGFVRLLQNALLGTLHGFRNIRDLRPDVIYVSTLTIPLWTVLGKLTGIPTITHVHEAERNAPLILRQALALPLSLSGTIVANSHFSLDTLESSLPLLRGKAQVIYNGVPGPGQASQPRADISDGIRVLFVGRLSHRKGVDVAIDAIAELGRRDLNATLSVVGAVYPGYEDYERRLHQKVHDLNIATRVKFHGFQSRMWSHLAAADVAVIPSRLDEPFGNTAVEAVLAGRPSVVSNTSGLREAAHGYTSVQYVEPGDASALADALERICDDWATFSEMCTVDADAAAVRHSPAAYQRQILAVVELAAGARS